MRLPLLIVPLLALAILAACTAPAPSSSSSTAKSSPSRQPGWVSLERTEGGTSIYLVTLFEDGRAVFEGLVDGRRRTLTKTVPRERVAAVFSKLESVDFWNRAARYDVERAMQGGDQVIVRTASNDAPWEILRAQRQSRLKRIDGLFFAPSELIELKTLIEETTGLAEWLAGSAR